MFKFILLIFFTLWVLVKLGGFFTRVFFGGLSNNQNRQQSSNQYQQDRQPSDGNVHIDYVPKEGKQPLKDKNFKGGDYVDYEEV